MTELVLAGLVSEEAAAAYDRLHAAVCLRTGAGPEEFDIATGPGKELLDADVITLSSYQDDNRVWVVHPSIAMRRLLDRRHRALSAMQSELAHAWQRFASLLSPVIGLGDGGPERADVRVVRDRVEMARLATGLYRSPSRLVRATFVAVDDGRPRSGGVVLPPQDAVGAGVEFRMIYEAGFAADPLGAAGIRESVAAGEQARIRRHLPLRMMHVDDRVALVSIGHAGTGGALHIEEPALLAVLAEWFDGLWRAPDTTPVGAAAPAALTPTQHKVLTLLASGLTDESIAHHTGTAVRTVRRHVSAILAALRVDSRFAAGVAAVRSGWL